jgi:hypothetical protein
MFMNAMPALEKRASMVPGIPAQSATNLSALESRSTVLMSFVACVSTQMLNYYFDDYDIICLSDSLDVNNSLAVTR